MPPEILFKPPLEREAGDGFYDLVEEMLCNSFRMSAQMKRVAAHLEIANYQVLSLSMGFSFYSNGLKINWDNGEHRQGEVGKTNVIFDFTSYSPFEGLPWIVLGCT